LRHSPTAYCNLHVATLRAPLTVDRPLTLVLSAEASPVLDGEAAWQRAPVEHDEAGAPRFACAGAPALALAHTAGLGGAAIAAPGVAWAGIDAEPVTAAGARALRQLAQQSGEAALAWADDHWPLRLWCAKEAAVKAERVPADVLGRSLRVEHVASLSADGIQVVTVRSHLGRAFEVRTSVVGAHVRAETA
jgi:hypothetical protein